MILCCLSLIALVMSPVNGISLQLSQVRAQMVSPPLAAFSETLRDDGSNQCAMDEATQCVYDDILKQPLQQFTGASSRVRLSGMSVWWLHFPKCGTSMGMSVRLCDRSQSRSEANHQVLPDNASSSVLSEVVAMFRKPDQRLMSAMSWMATAPSSCCTQDWGWKQATFDKVRQFVKGGDTPNNNNYLASFTGCQTSMMLGKGCMSQTPHSNVDIARAVGLVSRFLFVGLLEEWALSICLFNFKVTGKRFVEEFQLDNLRPTQGAGKPSTEYDTSSMLRDDADEEVYKAAKMRFEKDLGEYGITREACSSTRAGEPIDLPAKT